MIKPDRKWIEPVSVPLPVELSQAFPQDPFLAQALFARGITTIEQANVFINPDYHHSVPEDSFEELPKAVERIMLAIQRGEMIGVWGDFDVDGQTSTALLVSCLKMAGAKVDYRIPIRAEESHGINSQKLEEFLKNGVKLLISCDTGISANEAVRAAQIKGVDVIITDHHSLSDELPPAFAIINPNQLPVNHPLHGLSGVGTAFQLAKALLSFLNSPEEIDSFLDLVALGTVADLATLNPENRYLVQKGLIQLRENKRKGIQALLASAEVDPNHLTEEHISFIIAPRMNAIGRLSDANPMVDFLITQDEEQASKIALELENWNFERKLAVDSVFKAAIKQLENNSEFLDRPVLVLAQSNWEAGVNGIVASRLVNQFMKPALVISIQADGTAHGSARSVEGVDIYRLISQQKDLLSNHGGHPMAAGFSMKAEKIGKFNDRINMTFKQEYGAMPIQSDLKIDVFFLLDSLEVSLAETIEKLAPFGPGNPRVVLASRNLSIIGQNAIGKNKEHLKIKIQDPAGNTRDVLWWQGDASLLPQESFDLAYSIRANDFQGRRDIQMEWISWREITEKEISVQPITNLKIKDIRQENLEWILERLKQHGDSELIIWGEGREYPDIHNVNRAQLIKADTLAILTIPPRKDILDDAVQLVKPKEVWLMGIDPEMDEVKIFLSKLMGLVKHTIHQKGGILEKEILAALTSQPVIAIDTGVQLIAAQGNITIEDDNGMLLKIGPGGQKNQKDEQSSLAELKRILQENAAFRRFYLSAAPSQLFS